MGATRSLLAAKSLKRWAGGPRPRPWQWTHPTQLTVRIKPSQGRRCCQILDARFAHQRLSGLIDLTGLPVLLWESGHAGRRQLSQGHLTPDEGPYLWDALWAARAGRKAQSRYEAIFLVSVQLIQDLSNLCQVPALIPTKRRMKENPGFEQMVSFPEFVSTVCPAPGVGYVSLSRLLMLSP